MQDVLDAPILVGRLNKKQGLNGFVPAEVGHPVFEYKDRYLIFLKCLTKTAEQVPDGNGGHTKHMIQYNVRRKLKKRPTVRQLLWQCLQMFYF